MVLVEGFSRLTTVPRSTQVGSRDAVSHTWGSVDATFGSTTCSGPVAVSTYRRPRETGGAMSLQCDDGSLFAATVALEQDEDATADHPYRVFTLTDAPCTAG